MKRIARLQLYFAIFTAPLGAQFLNFSVGSFQMSPFRAAILLLVILGLASKKPVLIIPKGANRKTILFFWLWFVYAVISVAWSKDLTGWFKSVYFLFTGTSTILICTTLLNTEEDIKRAFVALQYGIMIQAAIGVYEIITRNYLFKSMNAVNYNWYVLGPDRIPIAMQGNPNDFATLMFVGVFVSIICIAFSKKKTAKSIYSAALVCYVILLFKSTSRANMIGLIVAVCFILIIQGKKRIFGILMVMIAFFAIPQLSDMIGSLFHFRFDAASGSDVVRLGLIKNGFRFLFATYGFGVGSGQIEYWMSNYAVYYHAKITNIHNWWMEILTAYGIFVFLGYICFYCRLFFGFFTQYKRDRTANRIIPECICATMVGFVVSSVSSSSNLTNEWLWVFWAICIAYSGVPLMTRESTIGL